MMGLYRIQCDGVDGASRKWSWRRGSTVTGGDVSALRQAHPRLPSSVILLSSTIIPDLQDAMNYNKLHVCSERTRVKFELRKKSTVCCIEFLLNCSYGHSNTVCVVRSCPYISFAMHLPFLPAVAFLLSRLYLLHYVAFRSQIFVCWTPASIPHTFLILHDDRYHHPNPQSITHTRIRQQCSSCQPSGFHYYRISRASPGRAASHFPIHVFMPLHRARP